MTDAAPELPADVAGAGHQLAELVDAAAREIGVSGVVRIDGVRATPVERAYGMRHRALGVPNTADTLFGTASATKSLKDAQLGFFGVLHTWGRDPMVYHPHVHFVVPGGGAVLDSKGKPIAWKSTPTNFLVKHSQLVRMYNAKLADALMAEKVI